MEGWFAQREISRSRLHPPDQNGKSAVMCGRYTLTKEEKRLLERYGNPPGYQEAFRPRFNIAPTQQALVFLIEENPVLKNLRWGLIPSWAQDEKIGNQMINARCETVAEKPAFRAAFKKRRCLVVADGFYEWIKTPDGKAPVWITQRNHEPFCFAGLWESWRSPEGKDVRTFSIITTTANELLSCVHTRMPVILGEKDYNQWLDPKVADKDSLAKLLRPYASEAMQFYPVNTLVNNPRHDRAECIARKDAEF
jgi:putative SOS response-associated peptidase YedK